MNTTPSKPSSTSTCGCTNACASSILDSSQALPQSEIAGVPVFRIPTMDCASEEGEIRHAVANIPGVRSLQFQLAARTLSIDAEAESLPLVLAAIRKAGFKPAPLSSNAPDSGAHGHDHGHEAHDHDHNDASFPSGIQKYALALALAVGAESIAFFAPDTRIFQGLGMVLSVGAIALAGFSTYVKGLAALRNFRLNINALMTVAVTGAFLIGQWPEAAMVMALYAIAEMIEARAVDRARGAIKSLLDLTPETAEIRQSDGSWQIVPVSGVVLDAVVRIKPGARIPVDGVIAIGNTSVDQASVTGESIPVDKAPGDAVFAGTINATATIEVRVTALPSNSVLSRIIHAVEQAQGSRAPTQQFVDKFAAIYTPAVFVLALGVAIFTPWLMDWTWAQAIYKALVLLVIACPCALVISTPVTVVSGLAAAARRGILIKGGVHLEGARKIKVVALDKTGTITEASLSWWIRSLSHQTYLSGKS
jgi:Cd2+/Zn2+-exporting ATPase